MSIAMWALERVRVHTIDGTDLLRQGAARLGLAHRDLLDPEGLEHGDGQ